MEWIQIASTFGFPAFFSVLLFVAYKAIVVQVIEVVKANTQAMQMFCQRIEAVERALARGEGGGYVDRR